MDADLLGAHLIDVTLADMKALAGPLERVTPDTMTDAAGALVGTLANVDSIGFIAVEPAAEPVRQVMATAACVARALGAADRSFRSNINILNEILVIVPQACMMTSSPAIRAST